MFENYKKFIKENKHKLSTKHYYVLYVDMLGYKDMLDNDENFIFKIKYFLSVIVKEKIESYEDSQFIYQMFSDNFILCLPIEENRALERIINFATRIQSMVMFHLGILLRGSITKGKIYLDEDLVYGEGLVKAYLLETNDCIYPRIIIDKELYGEKYIKESKHRVVQFKDNYKFANYLHFYFPGSIDDSPGRKKQLHMIHESIKNMRDKNKEEQEKGILKKINWTIEFHEFILDKQDVLKYYI